MIGRSESTGYPDVPPTEAALLDELQTILERQVELARRGSVAGLDELGERASAIATRITEAGFTDSTAFSGRKLALVGLYRELYLTLTAQREETAAALRRVRQGKRTVSAYRRNP